MKILIIQKKLQKINEMNIKELFYYLGFFLLCFMVNSDISNLIEYPQVLRKAIVLCIFIFLATKIITDKYSIKQLIAMSIVGVICLYTSLKIENWMFVMNFLAIIALKNISIKKAVKIDIVVKSAFLVLHTITYLITIAFGITLSQNVVMLTESGIRESLFFTHPNAITGLVFWLIIDFIYLNRNSKKGLIKTLIFGGIMLGAYYTVTLSRTPIYMYGLTIILVIYTMIWKGSFKLLKIISKYTIDILFIITIFFCINYNHMEYGSFNDLLSGRLNYSQKAYLAYGGNIVANEESINLDDEFIVDNFYARSLVSYGVIIVIMTSFILKKGIQNTDTITKVIIILFSVFLFSELSSFTIGRAIPLLIIGKHAFFSKEVEDGSN